MLQLRIIRRFKEHFCNKLQCVLELRKWWVAITRTCLPYSQNGWGWKGPHPQLKQLQPQLVQWGTVERTVPEADKLSLPTDIVLLGLRLTEKKKCLWLYICILLKSILEGVQNIQVITILCCFLLYCRADANRSASHPYPVHYVWNIQERDEGRTAAGPQHSGQNIPLLRWATGDAQAILLQNEGETAGIMWGRERT